MFGKVSGVEGGKVGCGLRWLIANILICKKRLALEVKNPQRQHRGMMEIHRIECGILL
eukprot:GDKH01023955.1.p2 GENE.GDKH01023955.1~~GDKH01023955.1.p2  ORF type:complete len:58 (-),score=0.40 GDKH01023955.1:123-296(-)